MTTTHAYEYRTMDPAELPRGLLWGTPRALQGQAVEVEYGTFARDGFAHGDPYMRTRDRAETMAWTHYQRVIRSPR